MCLLSHYLDQLTISGATRWCGGATWWCGGATGGAVLRRCSLHRLCPISRRRTRSEHLLNKNTLVTSSSHPIYQLSALNLTPKFHPLLMARKRNQPQISSQNADVNPPTNLSENQPKKIRKTRGPSLMKGIAKDMGNGVRLPVHWNAKGQPHGENKSKLSTYIGTVTKRWVPITINDWSLISNEQLDAIWEGVLEAFILPIEKKDWLLKKAHELWKAFKRDMGKKMYDKDTKELQVVPPEGYDSYITEDQWTEFIQYRHSAEFKEQSEKFRELSEKNDYSYRGSRKGYVGIEDEYKLEHNMDPSAIVPRAILWMKARTKKSGEYCEKSKPVIEKLQQYVEQEASGNLVTSGQQDVLALALGKPEHPGRVRGVGGDVTISQYWPRSKASSSKANASRDLAISSLLDEMNAMKNTFGAKIEALENIIENLMREKQLKEGQPNQSGPIPATPVAETPCLQSGKASCSIKNSTPSVAKDCQSCELYWPDLKQAVGIGKVYRFSSGSSMVLHTTPLEKGYVTVEVVTILKGEVEVPRPTDDVRIVKDAIGYFIAWPEHLVISSKALEHSDSEQLKEKGKGNTLTKESIIGDIDVESEASNLDAYQWLLKDFDGDKLVKVEIASEIFQYEHQEIDIGKEDIERWMNRKEVGVSHVLLYMRYLFENYCNGIEDKFKFLCPTQISPMARTLEQRAAHISNSMGGDVKGKIYIAPYQFRYHWVLILMNPQLGYAYWIDPRHGKREKDADALVSLSYKLKYSKLGKRTPRKQTYWHELKCPLQKDEIDCGYYMLKFMKDILCRKSDVITHSVFDSKPTYTHEDIDEIRKEWLDHFLTLT